MKQQYRIDIRMLSGGYEGPGAAFNEKEWKQRVDNAKAEKESINRYAGLKVGSMEEASTDGNWEKL